MHGMDACTAHCAVMQCEAGRDRPECRMRAQDNTRGIGCMCGWDGLAGDWSVWMVQGEGGGRWAGCGAGGPTRYAMDGWMDEGST